MSGQTPPTWAEIQDLIDRVDEVCRASEFARAQAERALRRPPVWPDRRQPARKHPQLDVDPADEDADGL